MDIECKEGRHWLDIAVMKLCSERKGGCDRCNLPKNDKQPSTTDEPPNIATVKKPIPEVIFPPSFPLPKKPQKNRPFLGAFNHNELKFHLDRYCLFCETEVVYHTLQFGIATIEIYWCTQHKMALWEAQTYIRKS